MSKYQAAHANPQGPGDARPSALEIVKDEGLVGKLADKVVFITGANQGIGLETARAIHATGATVFLGVRDLKKGQEAKLQLIQLELDSLDSVRSSANDFLSKSSKLNILINNAGIMATPEGRTKDGSERQFGTNHLGHFLLFQLLKPVLLSSSTPSEVRFHDLNFDESGSYDPWVSYGQSKTANIYFANELERRYGAKGLHGISLHPGSIATNLSQYLDPEVLKKATEDETSRRYFKSPSQGASTSGRGGRYLSDCVEQGPAAPDTTPLDLVDLGYAPWAYDQEKEGKLWKVSCELVGVPDTDSGKNLEARRHGSQASIVN
ncbi:hypothetical protein EDB80DRAFT_756735 [Ilyonectria destructans]|nr:hypothetical protein EDB80DRAFT_756735 [Ilyonectria destructans]